MDSNTGKRLLRRWWTKGGRLDVAIAVSTLFIIAIIWVATVERIAHERADAIAGAHKENANLAMALEAHTVRTLKGIDQTLLQIVREYGEKGMELNLAQLLRDGSIDGSILHNVGIINEHGDVVLNSLEFKPMTADDREYFRVQRDRDDLGMFVGQPLLGRVTGKWALHASRRISKPDGSFGGVAFAAVDPHYFTDFYAQADLGKQGLVQLVGFDGVTRARRVGDQGSYGQGARGSTLFKEAAKAPAGNFVSKGAQEGIPRFTSYRTVRDYPLIVAVGTSYVETLAEFNERRRLYYLGSSLATLSVVVLAAVLIGGLRGQRRTMQELEFKTGLLATEQEASLDAILLVDEHGKILSYNRRFTELWRIPQSMVRAGEDEAVLRSVVDQIRDPAAFLSRVRYLYQHRDESSHDDLQTRDGRIIQRYSAPVTGPKGTYYGRVWYFRDVTEHRCHEAKLRESERRFRQMADTIDQVFWLASPDGSSIQYVSPAFEAIWGRTCTDLHADPLVWLRAIHPDDVSLVRHALEELAHGKPYDIQFRIARPDGTVRWINDRGYPVRDAAGQVLLTTGVASDVTERRRAEEELQFSAKAFESMADGVIVTDAQQRIVYINKAFANISGYQADEVLGGTPREFQSGRHDAAFYAGMWEEVRQSGQWRGEIWDRRKNGEVYPELLSISSVKDSSGSVTHYVGVCTDISSLKHYEEQLHHQAHHDALTGLPNRMLYQERLREAIDRARRNGTKLAVLFMDVDHFKQINDSLGHHAGDDLLRAVAERLKACVRKTDTAARFGGDEFAILLEGLEQADSAGQVARKLLELLAAPVQLGEHQVFISGSVGISCFPQDGVDAEELLKNADTAMYRAKSEGRNNCQFFSAEMNASSLEHLVLSNGLRLALERDELLLHYQPCIDLNTGAVSGVEALLRWRHPERGMVSPAQFIPLAEETGLIEPIGEWVLETACRQMQAWRTAGTSLRRVAVNLSVRQFRQADLPQRIAAILQRTGLPGRHLELEVTESMVMQNPEKAARMLAELKTMGVTIAIDDFGTGYSSLSYLKRFPIDFLKIDQSFVKGLPGSADDGAIVKAIIALAKSLNLRLIAEGVETAGQRLFLERNGCDEGQGYLFSRPVAAGEIERLLGRPCPVREKKRCSQRARAGEEKDHTEKAYGVG